MTCMANLSCPSADLSTLGTRIGVSFSFAGFAMLVGPPIGGALKNIGFEATFAFSGAMTAAGSLILFFAAYLHQRRTQHKAVSST